MRTSKTNNRFLTKQNPFFVTLLIAAVIVMSTASYSNAETVDIVSISGSAVFAKSEHSIWLLEYRLNGLGFAIRYSRSLE